MAERGKHAGVPRIASSRFLQGTPEGSLCPGEVKLQSPTGPPRDTPHSLSICALPCQCAALRDLKYNAMRCFLTDKMPCLESSTLHLVVFLDLFFILTHRSFHFLSPFNP